MKRKECSQEGLLQSDEIAKGTEIMFRRWALPISRRLKEPWGNGRLGEWMGEGPARGKEKAGRGKRGRISRWDGRFL